MLPGPARAQGGVVYPATYVDVMAERSHLQRGAACAMPRCGVRTVGGDLCFNVPHEIARPDRFAVLASLGGILPGVAQDHEFVHRDPRRRDGIERKAIARHD